MTKVWVLTEELNEYDQYGEYFLAVFMQKPTKEQLTAFVDEELVDHVLNGGGRKDTEYRYYYLRQVNAN